MDYPIFAIGQQIVCIKSSINYNSPPVKGRVYTVDCDPAYNGSEWIVVEYDEEFEEFLACDFTEKCQKTSKESKELIAKAWADAMGIKL